MAGLRLQCPVMLVGLLRTVSGSSFGKTDPDMESPWFGPSGGLVAAESGSSAPVASTKS
jgi:hypothetical protein